MTTAGIPPRTHTGTVELVAEDFLDDSDGLRRLLDESRVQTRERLAEIALLERECHALQLDLEVKEAYSHHLEWLLAERAMEIDNLHRRLGDKDADDGVRVAEMTRLRNEGVKLDQARGFAQRVSFYRRIIQPLVRRVTRPSA